jgi:hypothetical protein
MKYVWAPLNLKNILVQDRFVENIKPKITETQFPKKTNEAQSSIDRRPIPLKDISSRA